MSATGGGLPRRSRSRVASRCSATPRCADRALRAVVITGFADRGSAGSHRRSGRPINGTLRDAPFGIEADEAAVALDVLGHRQPIDHVISHGREDEVVNVIYVEVEVATNPRRLMPDAQVQDAWKRLIFSPRSSISVIASIPI